MKTTRINTVFTSKEVISLGLVDKKNREVCAIVDRFNCEIVELPEDAKEYYTCDTVTGFVFGAYVSAGRNGKNYGGGECVKRFKTQEEVESFISNKVNEMKKRYAKQFKTK